jgi:hypothetical protein
VTALIILVHEVKVPVDLPLFSSLFKTRFLQLLR